MNSAPVHFATQATFRAWLREHHKTAGSLVVRIHKKHAAALGITYAQALDEALCFGWIDGIRRGLDGESFSVRFTPRRPRSIWSRVNVGHVERLIMTKRMTRAGLIAFQARTVERTGVYAFEQRPSRLAAPYLATFRKQRRAWDHFHEEAPSYRRTSIHWVMSAKREETRQRRLAELIKCSALGERIPQLRPATRGAD